MKKVTFWQITTFLSLITLFITPINSITNTKINNTNLSFEVEKVLAQDIYTRFTCPCCGQPLNKEKPCCDQMEDMIDFIDNQINTGESETKVMLETTKKFGLDRLANEQDREKIRSKLIALAPKNSPKISFIETKKDLGIVKQSQGVKTTDFTFKNEGKSDLVINNLTSSCGCTSGSIIYKDIESPRFYMPGHGHKNPDATWETVLKPDEEAIVKVYYDPNVHKDLIGAVTRTITIHTNDPVDPSSKLTIVLDQQK